jgi:hypothetical protein
MDKDTTPWLLLIVSLPSNSATARVRIWRTLKASGCASLRDGAYLLPQNDAHRQLLAELATETDREGGSAWLLNVQPQSADEEQSYRFLFNRGSDYAEWLAAIAQARSALSTQTAQEIGRQVRKLRRDYEAIRAIDFFPNDASTQADAAWRDFVHVSEAIRSPGEPNAADAPIPLLDISAYQGRTWATRKRLWVDRVACAWLIRRFIDPDARFLWLESPADCPSGALGFDFDGARFTHIGDRVSFEVLLASFSLEHDRGLMRLAAMVHALDVGGDPIAEASGFEAMLAGARQRLDNDDRLLDEMSTVLDSLHAYFSTMKTEGKS